MSTADLIILILLGLGTIKGFQHGFIIEIFSLLAFVLGIILALHLTIPVTAGFFGDSDFFEIIAIVVFIVLFVVLSVGIRFGGRLIKNVLDVTLLGKVDNFVGGITGLLKWAFIISVICWILESLGFGIHQKLTAESLIFPYIVDLAPQTLNWFSGLFPTIDDLLDSINNVVKAKEPFLS